MSNRVLGAMLYFLEELEGVFCVLWLLESACRIMVAMEDCTLSAVGPADDVLFTGSCRIRNRGYTAVLESMIYTLEVVNGVGCGMGVRGLCSAYCCVCCSVFLRSWRANFIC